MFARFFAGREGGQKSGYFWARFTRFVKPDFARPRLFWLSTGSSFWQSGLFFCALVLGLLVVSPFLLLFAGAWEADPEVVKTVFSSVFGTYVVNTVLLCVGVLLGSLAIGVTSAWLCSQYDFPLRRVFTLLLPLSIVISPYMRGLVFMEHANTWQFALYPFLQSSFPKASAFLAKWWNFPFLVWTLILSFFPYVYVFATALYQKNCRTVIESAKLLNGRSLFFSIGLPIAAPALRLGSAVVLMDTLNEYGAVSYFGFPSISSAVFRTWFGYQDIGSAKLVATLVLLIVVALLYCFRGRDEQFRYDIGQYYPGHREKLGLGKGLLCSLFCGLWIVIGFLVPVLQFVRWAYVVRWAVRPGAWSQLARLGLDTLGFVAIAVVIGMAITIPLSYMCHLRQKGLYRKVFQCMASGYALPSTIVAMAVLGLIYFLVRYLPLLPLLGNVLSLQGLLGSEGSLASDSSAIAELLISRTLFGLVFAAVLRFFFVIAKPVYQGFHHYGQRCEDAARSLGSPPAKTFWRVALPLNVPFLLGGGLLLVIELLKEIPLTLILRPFNFDTLAIRAYIMARDEMLYESAVPSLLIIAIGMICILAFQWIEEKWKPV